MLFIRNSINYELFYATWSCLIGAAPSTGPGGGNVRYITHFASAEPSSHSKFRVPSGKLHWLWVMLSLP